MLLMGVTEGAGGDTEIAAPLLRVDPGASTDLAFLEDPPAMAGDAATAVVPPSVAHRRSNVSGLR
jgi:hypothetical protein